MLQKHAHGRLRLLVFEQPIMLGAGNFHETFVRRRGMLLNVAALRGRELVGAEFIAYGIEALEAAELVLSDQKGDRECITRDSVRAGTGLPQAGTSNTPPDRSPAPPRRQTPVD